MIENTRRSSVCAILRLLLWVLLIVRNHEKSSSEAFLPGTIRREVSFEQPRKRACPSSFSLSSSPNNDYPVGTSDDRRNESLEQGHHPLWSLNLNLDSLAKAGAGSRAQELLRRIHALYTEGYYEVSPDIVSYNSVLKAWKEDEQPEAALELLETMIRNEREEEDELSFDASGDENKIIRVDVISFNTVIAAFANQGNYGKALDLLRKMQKSNNNRATSRDPTGIKNDYEEEEFDDYYYPDPDTITYNIVLYSLAQSDDLGTAAQAENLLREMMMRKEHTGMSVVDTRSFNTVLYAWSREGEKKDSSKTRPTTGVAGNDTVKTAAARTRPNRPVSVQMAAQRAEDLLTIMEELFEAGNSNVRPDVYSYTTTIQCWAKCSSINSKESNRPRSDTDSSSSSSFKAQEILNRMIERGLQPNKLTYTSLMNALARARQPERAEGVLRQMAISSNHQPDTVAYSSIIDAWAKISSKDKPEAASKAMQILETMKKKASLGMGPTATTYTSVLTALAKSGTRDACDQALNLLQDMETEYAALHAVAPGDSAANGDDKWSMRPTNIHYNCVLNAYARSSRSDKAIQAQKLMTVMENHSRLDCRPDTISYNSLMMACGHATGNWKERSFEIALRTFKILVSYGGGGKPVKGLLQQEPVNELYPTSSTFSNFFRACRKLLPPDNPRRTSVLTKSLVICRKLGLLNFLVVHQVQLSCRSEAAWEEMAGELSEYVGWKEDFKRCGKRVPREWTCNSRK